MLISLYIDIERINMLNIFNLKKTNQKPNTSFDPGILVKEERHHPPLTKEWYNGVYSYNKSIFKLLPSFDVTAIKYIRRYFYMFSRKLEKKIMAPRLRTWIRRYKASRILVAKPEFKHTSDKVTITLYVYNRDLHNNIRKLKNVEIFIKRWSKMKVRTLKFEKLLLLSKLVSRLMENVNKKKDLFFNALDKKSLFNINNNMLARLISKFLRRERLVLNFKKIINFNNYKFNSIYIMPLKIFLEKLYCKRVEFNIVSLKAHFLNSDILLQIMATKLRDRKSNVLKLIEHAFFRFDIPYDTRLQYFAELPSVSKIQNLYLKNCLNRNYVNFYPTMKSLTDDTFDYSNILTKKVKNDKLDMMLRNLLPEEYTITNMPSESKNKTKWLSSLKAMPIGLRRIENSVLDSIKHKTVGGIKIKASGRLTKRIIAARSITKVRQIGTIRNINSSYKGLSSVILRGHLRSNMEFAKAKNKSRIGSFGLKGWVSTV